MTGKTWHGGLSVGASCTCDECGAGVPVVYEIGITLSRSERGRWACRACIQNPAKQIAVIDRRGDTLTGDRIARELDAQTAIMLHLDSKAECGMYHGPLPPLPASYQHVIAVLNRCARADVEFAVALSELRDRYERAAFFTPKQTLLIQWRLSENGIQHTPSNFTVSTRSEKEIGQVRSLSDWRKKKIALYLSRQQRSRWGF